MNPMKMKWKIATLYPIKKVQKKKMKKQMHEWELTSSGKITVILF